MRRRQFLTRAGIATTGIAALGSTGVSAATYVPVVSTRDHFDDDGNLTDGHTTTDYDTDGTVPGIDTSCVNDMTVFIHGWDKDSSETEAEAAAEEKFEEADYYLDINGYDGTLVGYSWDNDKGDDDWDYGWGVSKEIADKNGYKLGQFLLDYKYYCGGTVRLVTHSLGARVAFAALVILDSSYYWDYFGFTLQSVHFTGAAVDNEYPTYEYEDGYYAITYETDATFNYYSQEDDVLEYIYNTYEFDQALGETGKESGNYAPSNYHDFDATSQVGDNHSGYLENVSDEIVYHMEHVYAYD